MFLIYLISLRVLIAWTINLSFQIAILCFTDTFSTHDQRCQDLKLKFVKNLVQGLILVIISKMTFSRQVVFIILYFFVQVRYQLYLMIGKFLIILLAKYQYSPSGLYSLSLIVHFQLWML